jgi:hypothetical protein
VRRSESQGSLRPASGVAQNSERVSKLLAALVVEETISGSVELDKSIIALPHSVCLPALRRVSGSKQVAVDEGDRDKVGAGLKS